MTIRGTIAPCKFSVKEIVQRSAATLVVGVTASPIGAALFDVEAWKAALYGGILGVVNLAGRLCQRWLAENPE